MKKNSFFFSVTFRKLLELISKQLQKDQYDLIIKEIIEEFCHYFQTTISLMNSISSIQVS
jgi:hypothetical protein